MSLTVRYMDSGKPPKCPPDPAYPYGIDIDASDGKPACWVKLPKVRTTGYFVVTCDVCFKRGMLTAAGRADDPRSYKMACR